MGLYDVRCGLSGVSLKRARAAVTLIAQRDDVWEPIWVPLDGKYNRLGAIDVDASVKPHVAHLAAAFRALIEAGRLEHRGDGFDGTDFFESVEPNRAFNAIDGRRVSLAFYAHDLIDGVISSTPIDAWDDIEALGVEEAFAQAFPDALLPLDAGLPDMSTRLHRLLALREWSKQTGWAWAPPSSYGQHYEDDCQKHYDEAKTRLAGHSEMLAALEQASASFLEG